MTKSVLSQRPRPTAVASRRGVALVLVLGCVVLVLAVSVAFMLGVSNELAASKSYSQETYVRLHAEAVVDVVKSQILEGSTRPNMAWASQPGALRTWDITGKADRIYKLYSSAEMIQDAATYTAGTAAAPSEVPADWRQRPTEYTDLNTPAAGLYPVLNPNAVGVVKGFQADPGFLSTDAAGLKQLPMPVAWLYLLKDGKLAPMVAATKKITGASAANPVVGRVAFWTDDETCKLNINCAGEGVFWDTPRGTGNGEKAYSSYQPAQREYQRYPGHPARLSLKTVFPALTAEQIYQMSPRIGSDDNGSDGGTKRPSDSNGDGVTDPLPLKNQRLYASLDELAFQPLLNAASPAVRLAAEPVASLTAANLNTLQFFLTAYNRAPELNLFNRPRISMWPVDKTVANRTAVDEWFDRCSTIGGKSFHIVRSNPRSPTADYNDNAFILDYLRTLTAQAIPGYGGNFLAKYGADRDSILTQMFDYIRCINLYDSSVGTLNAGSGLLVNTKAYALGSQNKSVYNSPVNQGDPLFNDGFGQVVPTRTASGLMGMGRFATISEAGFQFFALSTTPTYSGGNLTTANKHIRQNAAGPQDATNPPLYRAVFWLEPFTPALGYVQYNPDYIYEVDGLNTFSVTAGTTTTSLALPASAANYIFGQGAVATGSVVGGSAAGIGQNVTWNQFATGSKTTGLPTAANPKLFPFVSQSFALPDALDSFQFSGGTITVRIKGPDGDLIQTFTLNFPAAAVAKPGFFAAPATSIGLQAAGYTSRIAWAINTLIPAADTVISLEPTGPATDLRWLSLQTVVPASRFAPHQNYFTTTPSYTPPYNAASPPANSFPTANKAHSFSAHLASSHLGATYGTFLPLAQYPKPDVPSSITQVSNPAGLGDWDTGFGAARDGAFMNKPDEGNFKYTGVEIPYYFNYGNQSDIGYATYFIPNRQVPSPGVFGSLLSRAKADEAWETLAFSPNPAAGSAHPGLLSPPDYLWLDFFTMPIVEPYAISEPFSSAGKVNLNYQILPFTYITRDTAVRAALTPNLVSAIPDSAASTYKTGNVNLRSSIDADQTLKQFEAKFALNEIFRSAAEVCSLDLYPTGVVYDAGRTAIKSWWSARRLTGDNLREQPYTALYQNVTTQSNTYTVYVRAQTIQKARGTPADEMTSRDNVTGEYRGSYLIERFLDPNVASYDETQPITRFHFRTISNKQFLP